MTEMTMPEPAPSRKPVSWKVILSVVIIAVVLCFCILVVGVLAYMGSQGNGPFAFLQDILPSSGKSIAGDWLLYYDWGCTGEYYGPASITFLEDFTFVVTEGGDTSTGAWAGSGGNVEFIFDAYPSAHYVGMVDNASSSIEGTMTNSDGNDGCWYATR